jgi:hypothetical protein
MCFYAPISKLWLECYRAVPAYEVKRVDTTDQYDDLNVVPEMTLRRAVFASAARVRLAHELGLRFGTEGADSQFYIGRIKNIAVLDEAYRLGMPVSTHTLNGAATSGALSTVRWLRTEHNCAIHREADILCARSGQIEVLQWLKEQGLLFTADTMNSAALHGQGLTCAYLHAEGCPWDALTIRAAVYKNHWNTVRWLHEHGCPWKYDHTCLKAAQHGNIDIMTYMLQQELVPDYLLSEMLNAAGANQQLAAAQWLRQQQSAEWPPVLHYNGTFWSGDTLEWARAEGCDSPLNH